MVSNNDMILPEADADIVEQFLHADLKMMFNKPKNKIFQLGLIRYPPWPSPWP